MGSYINSQSDAEICEVLNKRFSDDVNANGQAYLDELRQFVQTNEQLFDNSHKLNRVFYRLAISVTGSANIPVPKNDNSRWRWYHLLKINLPSAVEKAIRDQLTAILNQTIGATSTVHYVTFSTAHVATQSKDQFELYDGGDPNDGNNHYNNSTPLSLSDANGKSYCALILQCNVDKALDDARGEDDPPKSDGGSVEKGPIPFSIPKPKKPSEKKSAKKKKAVKKKKAAKKAAKKAGKK